jgi:hypothetical protein
MKLRLRIEYADGSEKFTEAKFADFIGFERTWQRSVTAFEREVKLTDLAWLAWSAEHRAGKTALKFDPEWIGSVAMVTIADEQETEETATVNPS